MQHIPYLWRISVLNYLECQFSDKILYELVSKGKKENLLSLISFVQVTSRKDQDSGTIHREDKKTNCTGVLVVQ